MNTNLLHVLFRSGPEVKHNANPTLPVTWIVSLSDGTSAAKVVRAQ